MKQAEVPPTPVVDAVIYRRLSRRSWRFDARRVLAPDSTTESWTLLGNDLRPVGSVESFLAYLTAIERSPNTIKAYAHDLKDWWS